MNNYPKFIECKGVKYKINTDFRVALECDEIARDTTIGEFEKSLAIIYKLLGEEGIQNYENIAELLKLCIKYLHCGKNFEDLNNDEEPSMDFAQDQGYIKASFMSDYRIDLDSVEIHWWCFCDLMRGLTENSVLNRVRYVREEPLTGKKGKELEEWVKRKKAVELKRKKTSYELEMDKKWEEQMKKE